MATREPRDLLTRLADRGEEAIQRLSDAPGADRLLGVAQSLRDRMDEMQRRVRGLDELERRLAELERRVDELSAPSAAPGRSRARSGSAAKKPSGTSSSGSQSSATS
jgi:hypothetical protein